MTYYTKKNFQGGGVFIFKKKMLKCKSIKLAKDKLLEVFMV